jgi:hypothetical protein
VSLHSDLADRRFGFLVLFKLGNLLRRDDAVGQRILVSGDHGHVVAGDPRRDDSSTSSTRNERGFVQGYCTITASP